jgi:hypothetical protein
MSPDGYGRERWRRDRFRVSNPSLCVMGYSERGRVTPPHCITQTIFLSHRLL